MVIKVNYIPLIENIQKYNDLSSFDIIIKIFTPLILDIMNSKNINNTSACYDKVVREILRKTLEFDTKNIKYEKYNFF